MNPTQTPLNSVNVGTAAAPVWQNNGINAAVNVKSYQDNADGTTTNYLSDGTTSTVRYTPVAGGLQPTEVQANVTNQPVNVGALGQGKMSIPQAGIPTAANAIMGATDALSAQQQQAALLQQQQEQQQIQQADTKQSKSLLDNVYGQLMNFGNRQEQIYQNAGIDQKQQQVTQYTNELNAEKASAAQQIASLQNNAALNGMSSGALAGQIQRIQNESAIKQSITAVTLSAVSGDLQGAQAAADRRIKLELEPLQTRLEYAKQLYADNKDSLSKTEDKQWQVQINSLNKKLDQEYAEKQKMADLIINSGAPASVIQKAQQETSLTGVARALGQYNPAVLDRQVKLANIEQSRASTASSYASAAKTKYETQLLKNPSVNATLTPAQQKRADQLQGDFDNFSKTQRGVLTAAENITALADRAKDNPTAQVALIYQYMKSLDPNSTVREGEYATAKNTTGIQGKILNNYNKAVKGKIINDDQIQSYVADANRLKKEAESQLTNYSKEFDRRAAQSGLPANLFYQSSPDQAPQVVPATEVPQGYYQASDGKFYKK